MLFESLQFDDKKTIEYKDSSWIISFLHDDACDSITEFEWQ